MHNLEYLRDHVRSPEGARLLKPSGFEDRLMTQEEFTYLLTLFDAYWQYPGEPRKEVPHAITKAGDHTNGFIICSLLLENSNLCEIMAGQLLMRLRNLYQGPIDWVIDAAYSAIDLGVHVSRLANARHAIVEKDEKGAPTIWRDVHVIGKDERVLGVNELMTTAGGSTYEAKIAPATQNKILPVTFVPYVLVLVNRSMSDETLLDGTPVVSVVRYIIQTYKPGPHDCPYCAAGSPAYKPKTGTNWEEHFKPYIKI